jgi:predicted ATPase
VSLISAGQPLTAANIAQSFAKLQKSRREDLLVQALRLVDPAIERVEVVMDGGIGIPWVQRAGASLVPLPLVGDGANRAARLALSLLEVPGGVLLIDEFENGLHYSALEGLWRNLATLAKQYDVQVFATTHSRECVNAAYSAFDDAKDLRVYRLQTMPDSAVKVVEYSGSDISAAFDMNLELRWAPAPA